MRRDRGAVLINALVIVLVISAIAATLLTRAESARHRAQASRDSAQIGLYLDGIESLLPTLLREPAESGTANLGQAWARPAFVYEIDRGRVTAQIRDLQGGLNVNWLARPDAYVTDTFTSLFAELGVPIALVDAIADYLRSGGSERGNAYLLRRPPMLPRGGPIVTLVQLRAVDGMTAEYYRMLAPHISALPVDDRINLNTASKQVLRAVLAPFPAELVSETLARGPDKPMEGLSPFRNRLIEILETEDLDAYPVDRLTTGSEWFAARLTAELDGHTRVRGVILQRVLTPQVGMRIAHRWAEYD